MPLYECSKCGAVDNTALGNFWTRESKGLPRLCAECDERKTLEHRDRRERAKRD